MEILNRNIEKISEYPFDRLRKLLSSIKDPGNNKILDLSIGQPYHKFPSFVKSILAKENKKWGLYPPVRGIPLLRNAYLRWLKKRFKLKKNFVDEQNIVPLAGTREGLFSISMVLQMKQIIVPNPFYQAYLGASLFQQLPLIFMNAKKNENHLINLEKLEKRLINKPSLVYLCNPTNPEGKCASNDYLTKLIKIIRMQKSVLILDECYTDIYINKKPTGGMQVCEKIGGGLKNLLIFHSLSKRSNLAGLRSGFMVGDKNIIKIFSKLRSYSAPVIPVPVQLLSAKLWCDEKHVIESRRQYQLKFRYAHKVLSKYTNYEKPEAGFYLWLNVGDGESFAKELYRNFQIKVMPGLYLAKGTSHNPGKKFVRVSLVHGFAQCKRAINRIEEQIKCFQK